MFHPDMNDPLGVCYEDVFLPDNSVIRVLPFISTSLMFFQMSAVSTLINTPRMKNFVFRNYNLPPSTYSMYPGSCVNEVWQVIRASSAAPGYYEDFPLGDYVHSVSRHPCFALGLGWEVFLLVFLLFLLLLLFFSFSSLLLLLI